MQPGRSISCRSRCASRRSRAGVPGRRRPTWRVPTMSGHGKSGPVARHRKNSEGSNKVSAADVIAFIEGVCFVPEGKHVGEKLKLCDWQKREIERVYDNPVGTRRAILS